MLFTHHLPSGDRRVIGDRCGDRLTATYHHALNPDEQGRLWLQVIGDRGKCEKLLCVSVLPASFFFSLRAHIRTHEYNNVSFPSLPLSFSPAVEKICSTTSLWFSKLAYVFKKTSKKQWNIFGVYPKSEYFCTRFPGEESLAELTWWQSVGPPNYKNKKTPEKFGS